MAGSSPAMTQKMWRRFETNADRNAGPEFVCAGAVAVFRIQLSNSTRPRSFELRRTRASELQARVIAPCFVRPQGLPVFSVPFSRRGVRNDRAYHRARGAMCEHMASVCFRTRQQQQPRTQIVACVPHADGLFGLLPCPRGVTCADVTPFVRAVARTCTWTVRPSCRRLSPSAWTVFSDPKRPGRGIVAATRIPPRVSKTIATRPSPERDGW